MRRIPFAAVGLILAATALLPGADPKSPAERKNAILRLFADEFLTITPGKGKFPVKFRMGSEARDASASEKPAHDVTLSAPFAVAKYEVTQELYEAVMGSNPARWKGPRNSVEMVSWDDAGDFCKKVTDALRGEKLLGEGEVIRLPSEAEWEYACRAGTTTAWSFGDKEDAIKDFAWFKLNSKGEDPPVGRKKPNDWGLYDMHGYISEWCQDDWNPDYDGAPADGSARKVKGATERVARGGSYADTADQCRSAYRFHFAAGHKVDTLGFRCARTIK